MEVDENSWNLRCACFFAQVKNHIENCSEISQRVLGYHTVLLTQTRSEQLCLHPNLFAHVKVEKIR